MPSLPESIHQSVYSWTGKELEFQPFALGYLRNVVAFALELPPFAQLHPRKPATAGRRLVQSSRLERVRFVCFQLVAACSNSTCSRLEVRFRETLIAVLAPVRNFSSVCFERVTSNSVCGSEPVRNGAHGSIATVARGRRASLGDVSAFPFWESVARVSDTDTSVLLLLSLLLVALAI
jgi:hypothetical protein